MKPQARTGTADISFDPTGPFRGKWYIRRADGILNSYETLPELAAFADDRSLLATRYLDLMQEGRQWTSPERQEAQALEEWLAKHPATK